MPTPIILLVGQAGSGKDTVASFLVKNHGAISLAFADPMKRLGALIFDFSEEQLWGPSEKRNAPDGRYADPITWRIAEARLYDSPFMGRFSVGLLGWVRELFSNLTGRHQEEEEIARSVCRWFRELKMATYGQGKILTPRYMLQTLGTEWGRCHSRNLWVFYTLRCVTEILGGGCRYDRAKGLIEDLGYAGPNWVVISDGRFRNEVVMVNQVGGSVVRIDTPALSASGVELAGIAGHASEREQKGLPMHLFRALLLNDKRAGLAVCEQRVGELVQTLARTFFPVGDYDYVLAMNIAKL